MFKGLRNLGSIIKQAQQMGSKMQEVNEKLKHVRCVGTSGGGLVEVEVNGLSEMLRLTIDPSLVEKGDVELIEDLVPAAANQAQAKAREAHAATPSPGDDALRALDLEAERRHQRLKKANADALVVDALRIASDVQAWKLKPRAFGGGGNQADFEGIRFEQLGYQEDETGSYTNLNGVFALVAEGDTAYVIGTNVNFNNKVVVTIRGTRPGDVSTSVQNLDRDL